MEDNNKEIINDDNIDEKDIKSEEEQNIEDQNDENQDDEQNDDEWDDKIDSYIKKYKDIKELAKSKMSSDSEFSKLQSKTKVLEEMYWKKLYEKEKKLVTKDKKYILDVMDEDVKLAEKLSEDVFNVPLKQYLEEIQEEFLNWDVDETLNELLWEKVWKEDIEKLVQLRLKEEKLKLLKEQEQKDKEWQVTKAYDSFITENWIEWENEEIFKEIYNDILWDRKDNEKLSKRILKSALVLLKDETQDDEDKQKQIQDNARIIAWNSNKSSNNNSNKLWASQEDIAIAKKHNMKLEKYMELKKYQNF